MSLTDRTKPTDVSLNTDLYELTMAQGFWESGLVDTQATFNAFFRENPFGGGYAVACGMGQIPELVENFVFDDEDINYLASIPAPGGGSMFKPAFLEYLRNHHLDLTIHAVPEGDVVFPREPMVRVQGPLIDCQLIETALLNLVNFQTLVATKTSRVVRAAEGHPVSDFGLRRAQGPDGGLAVARASYIAGASSTSNLLAGKIYSIPVFGTHAHSWVMAFPTELDAFRAFAKSSPKNCVLLLDTYDVHQGIKNAITVAKEMEAAGERLAAIRIDSGDLAKLTKETRKAFDDAGLPYVKISASNDLDEYTIQSLYAQGAPIDSFGVGTKLAIAQLLDRHETVGEDLVAMCVDDVVPIGAEPLFFLDYVAIGRLRAEHVAKIVGGIAEGCRKSGCALVGGEMAEHPGVMNPNDYDLAGFVVGVVDRPKMIGPHLVHEGDVILGLSSSGIHSNGYSLVRKVAIEGKTVEELERPLPELGGESLADAVMRPTTIYAGGLVRALKAGVPIHAMAHITGGGITENLNRALPANVDAVVDRGGEDGPAWDVPPVITYMVRAAGLMPDEAYKTFNMGVGMSIICGRDDVDEVCEGLVAQGFSPFVMGECVAGEGKVTYR